MAIQKTNMKEAVLRSLESNDQDVGTQISKQATQLKLRLGAGAALLFLSSFLTGMKKGSVIGAKKAYRQWKFKQDQKQGFLATEVFHQNFDMKNFQKELRHNQINHFSVRTLESGDFEFSYHPSEHDKIMGVAHYFRQKIVNQEGAQKKVGKGVKGASENTAAILEEQIAQFQKEVSKKAKVKTLTKTPLSKDVKGVQR